MTEPSNSTATDSVRADDLSIVLFGLPGAGKSSLLGALAQAAQAQEHLLNGRLIDVSHGLDELRRRLYDEGARRTAEEVVPYPVDFEPFRPANRNSRSPEHLGAVFIDCDGRVANDLLVRRQAIPENSPEGTLAREVNDADTLVLVVDASAPPAQVESDFTEFDRFLRQMETTRGKRTEIGGLPVFLVLTKCDLLAQSGDTAADWMERIEQHKRDLDSRFRSFLTQRSPPSPPNIGGGKGGGSPFGRLDLHLWATAVKRPALAGTPAKAREPYGVAELFRQCLEQAAAFRNRRRRAGRRLVWTVGTTGGIVALMTALGIGFTVHNLDTPTNALRERVQVVLGSDMPSATDRLHAPIRELRRRADELRAIRNDPRFDALSTEQQRLIGDRLDELEAYLGYLDRLAQSPRPRDVHNAGALRAIKEELKTELALPEEAWKDTEAGRLYSDRVQDAEALALAVKRAEDWYRDNAAKAEELRTFAGQRTGRGAAGVNWDRWTTDAETLLRPDFRPPFSGPSPIPGAASKLTYEATVLRFDEVSAARTEWEWKKSRLQRVFDLCSALGLAMAGEKRPPVLALPRHFTLTQAGERRNALEQSYPHYKKNFVFDEIPDAIRPLVDQTAHSSYEHLLEPGQAIVLKQLEQGGGGEETQARWQSVRLWLRDPKELEAWRVLAGVLIRLHDPASPHTPESADPVSVLAEFLDRSSFSLNIRRTVLEIPESLERKPGADASLSIYHPASAGEKPALILPPTGEGERDPQRRVWRYEFRLSEQQTLSYRPGDALWATLPLRDDWMFTWVRCHSLMYQFERLTRPPRLHRTKEATTSGTLEEQVRLTILPADGVPRIPDLMPVVRMPAKE